MAMDGMVKMAKLQEHARREIDAAITCSTHSRQSRLFRHMALGSTNMYRTCSTNSRHNRLSCHVTLGSANIWYWSLPQMPLFLLAHCPWHAGCLERLPDENEWWGWDGNAAHGWHGL
eukprot:1161061-Pelagomonas_calceolata.AAC.8